MKFLSLLLLATFSLSFTHWQTNFETAKRIAREEGKFILLNFSGSDWCGPCIRLKKEVFDTEQFDKWADSSLVLVNADFPRNKKNQNPKDLQQHNEALADQYNPLGKFPFTLLLTAEGKVIQSWEGYPNDRQLFIDRLKSACDEHSH